MDPAAGTGIGSGGVVGAGAAGKVPMAAAAAPGAVMVAVAVDAAPPAGAAKPPAFNWKNLRRRWAQALVVFGCAAAALACFSISSSSPTALSRRLLGACPQTHAEAANLRHTSEFLLVCAAAQVLAAMTALLVPAARQVAVFALCVGWQTGYHSGSVLLMLFECHGSDAVLIACFSIFQLVVMVGYFVGSAIVGY